MQENLNTTHAKQFILYSSNKQYNLNKKKQKIINKKSIILTYANITFYSTFILKNKNIFVNNLLTFSTLPD